MSRCKFGLGLLVLLAAVCLLLSSWIIQALAPVEEALDLAREAALTQTWEEARLHRLRAEQEWTRLRHRLAALSDHGPLEQLDTLLQELAGREALKEPSAYAALCTQAQGLIRILAEAQQLSWWNVL